MARDAAQIIEEIAVRAAIDVWDSRERMLRGEIARQLEGLSKRFEETKRDQHHDYVGTWDQAIYLLDLVIKEIKAGERVNG